MNYMNFEAKTYHSTTKRRTYRAITESGFKSLIEQACAASAPRDAQINIGDDYSARITVERSFGADATLYISTRMASGESDIAQDGEANQVKITARRLAIEINWAGTSRDLIMAAAAIDIYQDLLRLGNHIDAALRGYDLALVRESVISNQ
jgi:hypothetical protein